MITETITETATPTIGDQPDDSVQMCRSNQIRTIRILTITNEPRSECLRLFYNEKHKLHKKL